MGPKRADPAIPTGEAAVDAIEDTRDRLRSTIRSSLGVGGEGRAGGEGERFGQALRASGAGWYPLLALSTLVMVDQLQGFGFTVLGPEVANSLGITKSELAALLALKILAVTVATLPIAAAVQRRPRRALLSVVTGYAWAAMTLVTGFVVNSWGLLTVLIADGASSGTAAVLHQPLLADTYVPAVRVRALSFYQGAISASSVVAPLIVALLTAVLGFTWRGVFLVSGVVCVIAAAYSSKLRDPGYGRLDTEVARHQVRKGAAPVDSEEVHEDLELGFFETARRTMQIPTMRRVLAATAVLGMLLVPFTTYVIFFLNERWGMGPGARGLFAAGMGLVSMAFLAAFVPRGEALFHADPARFVRLSGVTIGVAVIAIALAILSPVWGLMIGLFGVGYGLIALIAPMLAITVFSIVPAQSRPTASTLQGIFLAAVGGFGGLILLGGVDRRFGTSGAIISLAVPGIIAGLVLRRAGSTVEADLDRMIDDLVEQEEVAALVASGSHIPMLACRHIDFSYGQLQVLFDVNFSVDEGEMVALLGTNGAGKSTLLRVISGFGLPTTGSVRLRGGDITFVDPERRLRLGMGEIRGGKAVFGPLTVIENLQVQGYSHGRDRRAVDAGIDAAFDAFPRLGERRNQLASTLSGGEQQMLALSSALVVRYQVLLIDELSLGLAPKVVAELLEMVRRINAAGAAVVLVEQSVNVALSLVDHAYFMEKGEVRFDGRAGDLLGRPDLLRSVFLEGATKGLAAPR